MSRAAPLLVLCACVESINPEPLGDYTQWPDPIVVTGTAPGHANSYRIIYVNDLARDPLQPFVPGYQEGSIIVKEIRANDDGQPGALSYVAIMRRIGPIETALEDQGGWLYSESDVPQGPETHADFCWTRCHVVAPYNGAWYDYRSK